MITSQRHKRFHNFFTILAITISAIAIAMIIWFLIVYNNNEETNDAQVDQYVTPIATRISGYIIEVRFAENQFVKKGDTLSVQYASNIKSVCKKKGCWMKMELSDKETSFVKFKDYEFFVPLNADGSEAIVNGKAFVDVVSVSELKHYAQDAGKSKEEIKKITKPEVTYSFEASGVYIKK